MNNIIAFALWLLCHPLFGICTINGKEVPCSDFWGRFGWVFFLIFILAIAFFAFWVWMLVDCLSRKTLQGEEFKDKALWTVLILLVNWLGAVIYYFCVKRKGS